LTTLTGQRILGRLVDLVEVVDAREAVDREPAGAPELDELGDEDLRDAVALDDALDRAADGEHFVDVDALLGAQGRGPDQPARRIGAEHVDGLTQDARHAAGLEARLDPARDELLDRLHRVDLGGVDGSRRDGRRRTCGQPPHDA
jgi:hypothetical protein